jgi:uncharacterized protein
MTEQDKRNIDIVRRAYEQERDSLSNAIVWHVPGHNSVSGTYSGEHEYFEVMPSRMAPLGRWDFDLKHIMVNGDYVVTQFHIIGERNGKTLDQDGSHILRLQDNKVVEGWGFAADQDALDYFFS